MTRMLWLVKMITTVIVAQLFTLNCIEKTKIKKKRLEMWTKLKKLDD